MVSAVVAAFALVGVGVVLVLVRHLQARTDRQTEAILRSVDTHLEAISASVAQAVDRVLDSRSARPALLPTLDFDALVGTILAEAAARTGAEAVVLRVAGPGHEPVVASVGEHVDGELLERTFGPPDARPFRAATVDWTYAPTEDLEFSPFRSALVAPLSTDADEPGVLAVFSTSHDAFRAEQAGSLKALVEDAGVALDNARRFAEVEARTFVDPALGVPDRRGYERELERAVARARRTGRPLTVAIVAVDESRRAERRSGIGDLARLVTRVTRGTDVSCRRGGGELAIVLPETAEPDAARLTARLRDEARRALGRSGQTTFAVGLAEWHPDESVQALDARAAAALTRPLAAVSNASRPPRSFESAGIAPSGGETVADELVDDAVAELARRIGDARRLDHPLALVALEVAGLDDLADRLGRDVADAALAELVRRLDSHVGDGSVHRLGQATFALLLDGDTTSAETLLGALATDVGPAETESAIGLSAGVTEVVEGDDERAAFARAEHALWQARQAGRGTVVVALPGSRTPHSS